MLCSVRLYSGIFPPKIESRLIDNMYGTVDSIRTWGRTYIAVINIDNQGRFITRLPFAIYLPGDRIKFNGAVSPLKISRDKGFNEGRYWGARDVIFMTFKNCPKNSVLPLCVKKFRVHLQFIHLT